MNVVQINAVCGTGSTGRITVDLLTALKEAGHRGKIFYGVGKAPPELEGEACKIGSPLDYYGHNALSRLTDHAGWYSKRATRVLLHRLEAERPDLIHLHNLHGYYISYPLLFAGLRELAVPVVWTLHDCWAFTGHCTHFARVGCRQWQVECRACPQLGRYPKCVTRGDVRGNFQCKREAFCAGENMTLVTPSRWLAGLVEESFLGDCPIRVIPNGVDTGVFRPDGENFRCRYGLGDRSVILAVANGWNEHKGLPELLTLAEELDSSQRLVILGMTRDQCKQLPAGVLGLPRTACAEELAQAYRGADVLVNLSREETYPTVNLEAQACGTPVVTYGCCGSGETLLPGMGSAVPAGDRRALRNALSHWIGRGRPASPSTEELDRRTAARRYLDLYRQCRMGKEEL